MVRRHPRFTEEEKDKLWATYQRILQEDQDLNKKELYEVLDIRFIFMQVIQRPECALSYHLQNLIAAERRASRTPTPRQEWNERDY